MDGITIVRDRSMREIQIVPDEGRDLTPNGAIAAAEDYLRQRGQLGVWKYDAYYEGRFARTPGIIVLFVQEPVSA